jgi:hypothetical protein
MDAGRGHGIVCSEYLWTIIQALRYEAGHSYYQLTRSSPTGLNEEQFINTLLYGWDVRKKPDSNIATADEQEAFIKHLILAYIVRNELLFAPQITSVDQRFAPSEQAKSYSDAYVRSYGSKAKFIELYNAAIMMPYLQGILAYFLLVSYPIACMLVILPGHYKGFFTWVSFFAWIKIWDVGFAMVQVIERSVWAMVGNHGHMAATANVLIETAEKVGGIGVTNPVGMGMGNGGGVLKPSVLAAQGAVPLVCSLSGMNGECADNKAGFDQTLPKAMELFDKLLLTSANIDLDLSNGWYIYIMSALYLAVPAVTGQLVLGAKAGSASMMKEAWSGVANDGSNAAKTGAQHKDVNALTTNSRSVGQAAMAKAMRGTNPHTGKSFAMSAFGASNDSLQEGLASTAKELESGLLGTQATVASKAPDNFTRAAQLAENIGSPALKGFQALRGNNGSGNGGGGASIPGQLNNIGTQAARVALGRRADEMAVNVAATQQDLGYQKAGHGIASAGLKDYGGKLSSAADFEAQSAAWEAKNDFAAHAAAIGGVAGINAGNLAPGEKPSEMTQMAMGGMLESYSGGGFGTRPTHNAGKNNSVFDAATYSGTGYVAEGRAISAQGAGAAQKVQNTWNETGRSHSAADAVARTLAEGANPEPNVGFKDTAEFVTETGKFMVDAADGKIDSKHLQDLKRVDERGDMQPIPWSTPKSP